jgi:hypothetical protein
LSFALSDEIILIGLICGIVVFDNSGGYVRQVVLYAFGGSG